MKFPQTRRATERNIMAAGPHKVDITWDRRPAGVVAHVVFDNAPRLNVLNPPALLDLTEAFQSLSREDDLRVVVFSGADGYSLGAGLEVAAACDLRIAADNAHFGMPEVNVGIPSVVEAALLPRLIGWGRTSRLLLTAEAIDAAKAEAWGLVEEVVPAAKLDEAVERLVHAIVEAGPLTVRAQKRLMRRWERLSLDEAVQAGIDALAQSVTDGEHIERMGAFINRKKKGRS